MQVLVMQTPFKIDMPTIPFLDAMYLLNLLREIEKDSGYEPFNKPPQ